MSMLEGLPEGVEIQAEIRPEYASVLSHEALTFLATLHRQLNPRRLELLEARKATDAQLQQGWQPEFPAETADIRAGDWRVAPIPADMQKRWVEITGPTDRKMVINALNSGANMFMADFEDANVPSWDNLLQGQLNLQEAIRRTLTFQNPDGRTYKLNEQVAVLMVRPRGWHLNEGHVRVDGEVLSGSLFDFGLYFFHNVRELLARGSGPYFYLPKMEHYLEARLWNDAFNLAQHLVGLPHGTIKATVLLEHILLSFQIDEVLYELRDHIAGINAGRWDYIFSAIKKFRTQMTHPLPDRAQVTMTVPFMRAYTELLVRTCHKRGAHAMGGMAAFIPSRRDADVNAAALERVRADKLREANDGFDGTWVAHPDLVATAMEVFAEKLGEKPNQKDRLREDVNVSAAPLIDFNIPGGTITEGGVRNNISVAIQYIEAWLRGVGAVAIFNLMEDAATAEISRSQLWQWLHHPQARLDDGRPITAELYQQLAEEELLNIRQAVDDSAFEGGRYAEARDILDKLVLPETYAEFLTTLAYGYLN
ncbi:MAG: malate synthase A [bacterium]|nr:malate synthase A [bacterium]